MARQFTTPIVLPADPTTALQASTKGYTDVLSGHATVRTVTGATTAVAGETLRVNATSGAVTVTPPASPVVGTAISVVKTDSTANIVTWNGSTNSDSTCTFISQWAGATLVWDGTVWLVAAVNVSYSGLTTHAATHASGGADPVTPSAIGVVGADVIGSTRYAELASDVTVTNSTTLVNAGALSFTVSTGGVYLLGGHLRYSAPTGNDAKVAFTGPAMTSIQWSMHGLDVAATTTAGSLLSTSVVAIGAANTATLGGTGTSAPFPVARPAGVLKPSAGGTVQLQFAENTAGGGTSAVLYAPSFLTLQRVA